MESVSPVLKDLIVKEFIYSKVFYYGNIITKIFGPFHIVLGNVG